MQARDGHDGSRLLGVGGGGHANDKESNRHAEARLSVEFHWTRPRRRFVRGCGSAREENHTVCALTLRSRRLREKPRRRLNSTLGLLKMFGTSLLSPIITALPNGFGVSFIARLGYHRGIHELTGIAMRGICIPASRAVATISTGYKLRNGN